MKLPSPPPAYSVQDQAQTRATLQQADAKNVKTGDDIDIGSAKLVLKSPNGSRWQVVVDNSGALSTVAL